MNFKERTKRLFLAVCVVGGIVKRSDLVRHREGHIHANVCGPVFFLAI